MSAKKSFMRLHAQENQKSPPPGDRGSQNSGKEISRISWRDSSATPRGFDFEYRNMNVQQRVERARKSGENNAKINEIKLQLLEEEE